MVSQINHSSAHRATVARLHENICDDTLRHRFSAECEKGKTLCAAQIRRKQVEKALAGNGDTTMLIWLGKQLLGQRDKHELETNWPEKLGYGGLPVPEWDTKRGKTDRPN